ncbi:MAG TPA: YhjD/YihY/BrkB family envelope integrity protein [Candidatus Dormibacteraeota bacterium]|nr:YhjD/YihY/BrkB family envelope integrity protein [Candidatus Dormibacteraeota bacterium]
MQALLHTFPGRVLQKFLEDQAPNWAVLIAWNTLFAVFPIVVFLAAILGIVATFIGETKMVACHAVGGSRLTALDCTLLTALPSQTVNGAYFAIKHFEAQKGLLIVVGVLGLLWGGSALFGAMEQAFAVIYHTKPRDFLPQKVMSIGMIFLLTLFGGLAIISYLALPALPSIPGAPEALKGGLSLVVQVVVGLVAGSLLFLSIYFVVPNRPQQIGKVWPGALVAGTLFELVTLVFPLYINLTNSVVTYGKTFGLFFVVLTFFFFFGLITMVGVEVNSVLYPVPVDQSARANTITAAPRTAGEADSRGAPQVEPSSNGSHGPVRSGVKTRTAVLMTVGGTMVGVLLGRRSAGTD